MSETTKDKIESLEASMRVCRIAMNQVVDTYMLRAWFTREGISWDMQHDSDASNSVVRFTLFAFGGRLVAQCSDEDESTFEVAKQYLKRLQQQLKDEQLTESA